MKTLFLITLSLATLTIFSQEYNQLLNINHSWTIETEDYIAMPPEINQFTFSYNGDTIIETLEYKIFSGILIREDTINRKVYLKNGYSDDCLLFDFNAQEGDTIEVCDFQIIIDSVGTTKLNNGEERKIFYHRGTITGNYYIEGVGSDHGFIELSEAIGPPSINLLCFKNGNEELFGTRCNEVSALQKSNIVENKVKIYPNPANDFINIESNEKFEIIRLIDITG